MKEKIWRYDTIDLMDIADIYDGGEDIGEDVGEEWYFSKYDLWVDKLRILKKLINLTPHAVNLYKKDVLVETIEPSGIVPRLKEIEVQIDDLNGFPLMKKFFGEPEDMPEPQENTIYIVSALLAGQLKHRSDVVIPNDTIRNDKGQIIGCRGFAKI